jgi:hypothetical protein
MAPIPNRAVPPVTSIWYKTAAAGGPTTVTLTGPNGQLRISIAEYSGVTNPSPFVDGSCNYNYDVQPNTVDGGNFPHSAAGDLLVAGVETASNPTTFAAGSSDGVAATIRNQATGPNGTTALEDITSIAAGNQDATFVMSGDSSHGWNACEAIF